MGDQPRNSDKNPSSSLEENAQIAARKAIKYIINKEILAKLKKQNQDRRRSRRYILNSELLETNGRPAQGSKLIDLSMNGARLELPFSLPFMSQLTFTFSLGESKKIFKVVGRVIWSRLTSQRGRHEVGIQFYQNYWEIDQLLRLEVR